MVLGHLPLVDPVIQASIQDELNKLNLNDVSIDNWSIKNYTNTFVEWLKSNSYHRIIGLDQYAHHAYCVGCIDGIQNFIHRHVLQRRIRFSQAEFVANKIASNHSGARWAYLEVDSLDHNDAVIVSLPFSGNGGVYPNWDQLMETCNKLQIPVLLDMAYFAISSDIEFDLTHACITDVVTSLSKPFNVQLRLGLRLTRTPHDDLIQVNSDSKIINRIAAQIGIQTMEKYPADYIVSKYQNRAKEICSHLDLASTNTITLALGNEKNHGEYFRNGYYRVCITNELLQDI